jgi:hypothetical protein
MLVGHHAKRINLITIINGFVGSVIQKSRLSLGFTSGGNCRNLGNCRTIIICSSRAGGFTQGVEKSTEIDYRS